MKILIIQLARLGDIYMTWPALRALRRTYPQAEIHLLTRPRFEGAVEGLDAIDKHRSLPVSDILAPLVQQDADVDSSLQRLGGVIEELRAENFDWVINFTFSPVSSYLTHAICGEQTRVSGYSRYQDGTLCLSDDVSAYFYAQVGIGKANRVHVADIFASMLNLQYEESDWGAPEMKENSFLLPERYMVLHVGASERQKSLSATSWAQILRELGHNPSAMSVVLIGAAGEAEIAAEIQKLVPEIHFVNLVGQTRISDLFPILQDSELLIGCDSAPIHMASLTDTPTFNISVGQVNFWETGPKASLSFIYRAESEEKLDAADIGKVMGRLLAGEVDKNLIIRSGGLVSYECLESKDTRFQWDLVQALYLGAHYPIADKMEIIQGAMYLQEVNTFAMEQIRMIPEKGLEFIGPLLDQAEEIIQSISQRVPELSPLICWYQAERVRIGPGTLEEICAATLNVHDRMAGHLHAYIPHEILNDDEEGVCDGTL